MKLHQHKQKEIIELIELVINEDTHLYESLNKPTDKVFYSEEDLQKTIDEITSESIKKVFQDKLNDFKTERKNYLMETYGKYFLSDRLIRSVLGTPKGMKKKYSIFKKYY
jgi:hypothetical protein